MILRKWLNFIKNYRHWISPMPDLWFIIVRPYPSSEEMLPPSAVQRVGGCKCAVRFLKLSGDRL